MLESKDLFLNEAALTGETYPVEKTPSVLESDTPLAQRTNTLYMGTSVISGSARAVIVHTGNKTEFGKVSDRLKLRQSETEFEYGVRRFGYLLMEVTLMLVLSIFVINLFLDRPVLDSFLFSLALAVGLTPQLLPAIISINLSHGAKQMARNNVIVKRLASIENFGSMNVLCSDKTGTLTEGIVRIHSAVDVNGVPSEKVQLNAYLNASFETGYTNPIDEAILSDRPFDVSGYTKWDEIPYDFTRKRLSILVSEGNEHRIVTKGALQQILDVCSFVETGDGQVADLILHKDQIQRQFEDFSRQGLRTLGIAVRNIGSQSSMKIDDEANMTFLGFLLFNDPPKTGVADTIMNLRRLGISLKIITGDNHLIAANISRQIGLDQPKIMLGKELHAMSDEALMQQVNQIDIFSEVEPNQKERILLAAKKAGNVVGYIGDGINDASALHAADVGISVDSAVDVAKEAADIVLLGKDLDVLVRGVQEGRKTFANTLKYVFMATSANFGNMFSMAGASLFLPFLPLLPKQILLTNLLTDFPEMTIASDNVDPEMVDKPRRWDMKFIRQFMITFGIVSSLFDFVTFGVLRFMLHASPEQFRTGWFLESVVSASLIVLVIRTQRSVFKSKPGKHLVIATLLIIGLTLLLPFTPLGPLFGFKPLSPAIFIAVGLIVLLYMATAELVKKLFYKRINKSIGIF
ncbi:magnesium-translocating P-type ATPase [Cohnella soli]|uniref:Magnesium-translocating P-type ATPase n=1 Tax=Cohnella soli TaxID=425005 RepID=A0ABW0HWU1_9BACL